MKTNEQKGKISIYKSKAYALGFTVTHRASGKSWTFSPGEINSAKDFRVKFLQKVKKNSVLKNILETRNNATVERGLSHLLVGSYSSWHNLIVTININPLIINTYHLIKQKTKGISGFVKKNNTLSPLGLDSSVKELSNPLFLEGYYKEGDKRSVFPKVAAIYAITNLATRTTYIGETTNLKRRFFDHIGSLNNGRHSCIPLREDWLIYGGPTFMFKVLKLEKPCVGLNHVPVDSNLCLPSYRRELERQYIENWPDKIYNSPNHQQPRYSSGSTLPRHAVMVDGKIYPSYTVAAKETNRTMAAIRYAVGSLQQKNIFCLNHVEKVKKGNSLLFIPPSKDFINVDGTVLSVQQTLEQFKINTRELVKRLESGKMWSNWRFAFQSEINT